MISGARAASGPSLTFNPPYPHKYCLGNNGKFENMKDMKHSRRQCSLARGAGAAVYKGYKGFGDGEVDKERVGGS